MIIKGIGYRVSSEQLSDVRLDAETFQSFKSLLLSIDVFYPAQFDGRPLSESCIEEEYQELITNITNVLRSQVEAAIRKIKPLEGCRK